MVLTKQEAFDTVYVHLLTQEQKAVDYEGDCSYRTDTGLKCAIGCLIPDELYQNLMEGKLFTDLVWVYPSVVELFGDTDDVKGFYTRLQTIHDNYPVDQWKKTLKKVAKDYQLTVPKMPRKKEKSYE